MHHSRKWILAVALLLFAVLLTGCQGKQEEKDDWTIGGVVTFGRYSQTAEGTDETPIEWIVLDYDEANHRALLISKYGLDAKPYNIERTDVTWEICSLRTWLNNDFLNRAFTEEEQSAILMTEVDNSSAQGYSGWSTSGGNDTQDRIFLLSYTEANRYFNVEHNSASGSARNTTSRVAPTAYAIKQGAHRYAGTMTADGNYAGWWWLRSPGFYQYPVARVDNDGSLFYDFPDDDRGCIRPAFWINLDVIGCDVTGVGAEAVDSAGDGEQSSTTENIVSFGKYPQTADGTDETPIEWIVLEYDESNHRALLISKYGLDAMPYNTRFTDVTWEICGLRSWLNSDFLNRAFTEEEQSAILLTDVDNSSSQGYSRWSTNEENNTQDRVFLLSYAEASRYFDIKIDSWTGSDTDQNVASRVAPTAYAIEQGASTFARSKTADGRVAGWWWLRSPGFGQGRAVYVGDEGSFYYDRVIYGSGCVRPALWISLESDIF